MTAPVLYTPPGFSSTTPAATPLIVPFLRGGAIMGLEWTTLKFIEDAPLGVRIATFLIAIAMLAVLEKRHWLNFKGRNYFWGAVSGLIMIYVGIVSYAVYNWSGSERGHAHTTTAGPVAPKELLITNPTIDWNGGVGPIVFSGQYSRTGEQLDVFIEWGMLIRTAPVVGGFINWDGRRFPLDSKDRYVRNAEMKSTIGTVTEAEGGHLLLQLGKDLNFKVGIGNASYVFRVVFISRNGDEESYLFAMIGTLSQANKPLAAVIVDPAVFLGRGNMK
jgi:hypothetical protein